MKRISAIALFAIASLAGISNASAQDQAVQSNVPFNFTVSGRMLPANTYTITSSEPGLLTIQSTDKR